MKRCVACGRRKPNLEFWRNSKAPDGYMDRCKACQQRIDADTPPVARVKTCSKCGQEKPLDQFHRHRGRKDGCQAYCKACQAAHRKTPEGEEARRRYSRSPEGRKAQKRYWQSAKGKETHRRSTSSYKQANLEKIKAHNTTNSAIKAGKLPAPGTKTCEACGKPAVLYHHESYERPLEVMALCRPCHRDRHSGG